MTVTPSGQRQCGTPHFPPGEVGDGLGVKGLCSPLVTASSAAIGLVLSLGWARPWERTASRGGLAPRRHSLPGKRALLEGREHFHGHKNPAGQSSCA